MNQRATIAGTLLSVLLILLAPVSHAQERTSPPCPVVPMAAEAPDIDGSISEDAWNDALVLTLDFEVSPGENLEAPVRTELLLMYDKTFVYAAFRAYDPEPESIRARYRDRDSAFQDDFVGIVFDTFNDQLHAYEFFVNPLGVQMDLTMNDVSGDEDASWNAIWQSAGQLTEFGYTVELAVPFTQIRFQSGDGLQTWGLDAVRVYPRSDRTLIALNPRDRNTSRYLTQLRRIQGFAGVERGRNIEVVPTVTAQRTDKRQTLPAGPLETEENGAEGGLTGRWGITPNITLNGTINPDFSQVEADSVQLDINETFALFYPETRPFFLDGAQYFTVNRFNLVHTRTINNPDLAVKTTGKTGRHSYGLLTAQDAVTTIVLPRAQGSSTAEFASESTASIFRYSMDFSTNSAAGALITNRQGNGFSSTAAGGDISWRLTKSDSFVASLVGSSTTYNDRMIQRFALEDPSVQGHALGLQYQHHERSWFADVTYNDISEGFRADLGFIPQVGYRQGAISGGYDMWGDNSTFFRRITAGGQLDYREDYDGGLLERESELYIRARGPMRSLLYVSAAYRDQVFEGRTFEQRVYTTVFDIWAGGDAFFSILSSWGDHIDFANSRPAKRLYTSIFMQYNLGRRMYLSLDYDFSTLNVDGGRLFSTNVPQIRAVYQFSNRLFLRSIFQFVHIRRDTELYKDDAVAPLTEDLATQILLSYKINPQTVFYAGYSDQYEGTELFDLTRRNRAFFLKLSYAWLR